MPIIGVPNVRHKYTCIKIDVRRGMEKLRPWMLRASPKKNPGCAHRVTLTGVECIMRAKQDIHVCNAWELGLAP